MLQILEKLRLAPLSRSGPTSTPPENLKLDLPQYLRNTHGKYVSEIGFSTARLFKTTAVCQVKFYE